MKCHLGGMSFHRCPFTPWPFWPGSSCSFPQPVPDAHCRLRRFQPPTVPVHRLQSDMNIACSNTRGKGYIKSYIFNATFSMPIKRLYAKDQIMSFCTVWEQDTRERCGKWQWSHPGAAAFSNWHLEGICRACCKHIVLQAPQLLGPIGFLHLWRFPIG